MSQSPQYGMFVSKCAGKLWPEDRLLFFTWPQGETCLNVHLARGTVLVQEGVSTGNVCKHMCVLVCIWLSNTSVSVSYLCWYIQHLAWRQYLCVSVSEWKNIKHTVWVWVLLSRSVTVWPCSHLALTCILGDPITSSQLELRQFAPGIRMCPHTHLEWPFVIGSHPPDLYANKHVHQFHLQRPKRVVIFNRWEAVMYFLCLVCWKWKERNRSNTDWVYSLVCSR